MENRKIKIAASMSCADFNNLGKEVEALEQSGIDILHFDFCDGFFAPTFLFSPMILKSLRSQTKLRFDVHMYCKYPSRYLKETAEAGADTIVVHLEIEEDYREVVKRIKDLGLEAGIAILPDSKVPEKIYDIFQDISLVIANTVGPAYSGQRFNNKGLVNMKKIDSMARQGRNDLDIAADGNVSLKRFEDLACSGANIFILGSSGLFFGNMDYGKNVKKFRNKIEDYLKQNPCFKR